jgi:hypothetical protein
LRTGVEDRLATGFALCILTCAAAAGVDTIGISATSANPISTKIVVKILFVIAIIRLPLRVK